MSDNTADSGLIPNPNNYLATVSAGSTIPAIIALLFVIVFVYVISKQV